jgi:hypothetical protein
MAEQGDINSYYRRMTEKMSSADIECPMNEKIISTDIDCLITEKDHFR